MLSEPLIYTKFDKFVKQNTFSLIQPGKFQKMIRDGTCAIRNKFANVIPAANMLLVRSMEAWISICIYHLMQKICKSAFSHLPYPSVLTRLENCPGQTIFVLDKTFVHHC